MARAAAPRPFLPPQDLFRSLAGPCVPQRERELELELAAETKSLRAALAVALCCWREWLLTLNVHELAYYRTGFVFVFVSISQSASGEPESSCSRSASRPALLCGDHLLTRTTGNHAWTRTRCYGSGGRRRRSTVINIHINLI